MNDHSSNPRLRFQTLENHCPYHCPYHGDATDKFGSMAGLVSDSNPAIEDMSGWTARLAFKRKIQDQSRFPTLEEIRTTESFWYLFFIEIRIYRAESRSKYLLAVSSVLCLSTFFFIG